MVVVLLLALMMLKPVKTSKKLWRRLPRLRVGRRTDAEARAWMPLKAVATAAAE